LLDATLQDLPDDTSGPRFVINATSVQTGALFRFSRPYLADYRVGRILNPTVELAVAASPAFPPVLSPCTIDFDRSAWKAS
jgi:NTE family protein